jgi:hypothetical protein
MSASVLYRNKPYDGVRLIYDRVSYPVGTPIDLTYSEASGERYYYTLIGTTYSTEMEAATFKSFVSATMSGGVAHIVNLVPLLPGEMVHLQLRVTAMNASTTKGFLATTDAAFYHTGSVIQPVGGTAGVQYNIRKDFATASIYYLANATQSVTLLIGGEPGEVLDWSLFIEYSKSFHSISTPATPPPQKPIYPIQNNPTS